ncbi:RNA polymerase sigma factor [Longitalea arenae]|uniref:RNA polymerase sigma factor n=1 Tax=Longitalea arenae TaxID=2812558 RepID=UPI001967D82E|nr:RNA polymerase sigma factor [Longitalea arenae]
MLEQYELDQFNARNHEIFTKLFHKYHKEIVILCFSLLEDLDKAKGLAQETFIKLWENQRPFESEGHIKGFLFTTARNMCIDKLRKYKTIRRFQKWLQQSQEVEDPQAIHDHAATDAIVQIIQDLSPRQKDILTEAYTNGRTNKEIGAKLGISAEAVRQQKIQTLRQIKLQLMNTILAILVIACAWSMATLLIKIPFTLFLYPPLRL